MCNVCAHRLPSRSLLWSINGNHSGCQHRFAPAFARDECLLRIITSISLVLNRIKLSYNVVVMWLNRVHFDNCCLSTATHSLCTLFQFILWLLVLFLVLVAHFFFCAIFCSTLFIQFAHYGFLFSFFFGKMFCNAIVRFSYQMHGWHHVCAFIYVCWFFVLFSFFAPNLIKVHLKSIRFVSQIFACYSSLQWGVFVLLLLFFGWKVHINNLALLSNVYNINWSIW